MSDSNQPEFPYTAFVGASQALEYKAKADLLRLNILRWFNTTLPLTDYWRAQIDKDRAEIRMLEAQVEETAHQYEGTAEILARIASM